METTNDSSAVIVVSRLDAGKFCSGISVSPGAGGSVPSQELIRLYQDLGDAVALFLKNRGGLGVLGEPYGVLSLKPRVY